MNIPNLFRKPMLHASLSAVALGTALGAVSESLRPSYGIDPAAYHLRVYSESSPYTLPSSTKEFFETRPDLLDEAQEARTHYLAKKQKEDPEGYAQLIREEKIREYLNTPPTPPSLDYGRAQLAEALSRHGALGQNAYNASLEDIDFLVRVVATEVGEGEPAEGIDGVINVILNRYENTCFPDTIRDVLDAELTDGAKEFAAIHWSERIFPQRGYDGNITAVRSLRTAGFSPEYIDAIQGRVIEHLYFPDSDAHGTIDNTHGATFYANDSISDLAGMQTTGGPLETLTRIGAHAFYGMPDTDACGPR